MQTVFIKPKIHFYGERIHAYTGPAVFSVFFDFSDFCGASNARLSLFSERVIIVARTVTCLQKWSMREKIGGETAEGREIPIAEATTHSMLDTCRLIIEFLEVGCSSFEQCVLDCQSDEE